MAKDKIKGPRCPNDECSSRIHMTLVELSAAKGAASCQILYCKACGHIVNTFPSTSQV